jgi:predicted phosphoadenosine phosphosulfate sulfurtransferase
LKKYLDKNVYEATQERLKFIFEEFDNIYLSFSGGKDSGVLLNLVVDFMKKNKINKKIDVLFIDLECFYSQHIQYVENQFNELKDYINVYWVALPLTTRNAVSTYEPYYIVWDSDKKDLWIRDLPINSINLDNNIFDFYKLNMTFEAFIVKFAEWYVKKKQSNVNCALIGIRADESLNRFRAITNEKNKYKDICYSTKINNNIYNLYPIYDWRVEDIWIANSKFKWLYNPIYDLFYKAGMNLSSMRICEPFGDDQRVSLNMYRVIEPEIWRKLLLRVEGVNYGNIYCKTRALGYQFITLPQNHTWKSYTKFLLNTLPKEIKEHYVKKFITYIRYWYKNGSALTDDIVDKLIKNNFNVKKNGLSKRGKKDKLAIRFLNIPDNTDIIKVNTDILSWKKMAICIIKNDVACKSLNFCQTKETILNKIKKIETATKWSGEND